MVALLITSFEKGSGKTTLAAGLIKHLLDDNRKAGFFKPAIGERDNDAAFIKGLFSLGEPIDVISPVFSDESTMKAGVKEAYASIARGKDVVVIEGTSDVSRSIAETLDARVLVVEGYSKEPKTARYQDFGKRLVGVVLNKVPKNRVEQARAQLSKAGIDALGALPEDRTLLALTIGEMAEHIKGEILHGADRSSELVENFMLGAFPVDPGIDYFARKTDKAVILRSGRPDMQLAALATSTKCLVLTGKTAVTPGVLFLAEDKNVPVILAKDDDVTSVVSKIDDVIGKDKLNESKKLPRISGLVEQHFDFQALYKGLGLK